MNVIIPGMVFYTCDPVSIVGMVVRIDNERVYFIRPRMTWSTDHVIQIGEETLPDDFPVGALGYREFYLNYDADFNQLPYMVSPVYDPQMLNGDDGDNAISDLILRH